MNTLIFRKNKVGELQISGKKASLPQEIEGSLQNIEAVRFAFRGMDYAYENEFPLAIWQKTPFFFEWEPIELFFEISSPNIYRLPFEVYINGHSEKLKSTGTEKGQKLSGTINLRNAVGYSEIKIIDARGYEVFGLFIEVFPQKIDYKEDFNEMISEISDIVYNLAFDYLKKSYAFARPKHSQDIGLNEWLAVLNQLFEYLEMSIDHILRKPASKVIQNQFIKPVEKIKRFHPSSYKWIGKNKRYLNRESQRGIQINPKLFISHLPDAQKHLSYDTFANRFVKWAIEQIIAQIQELSLRVKQQSNSNQKIKSELQTLAQYKMRLQQRLKNAVFSEVKALGNDRSQSNVLNMAPAYRDFYHRFLLLHKGLYLHHSDIFRLDYKDIATLYEYWCFLTLVKSLKKLSNFKLNKQNLIGVEHNKLSLRLKKGAVSEISLKNDIGDEVKIFYNKPLKSDTFTQIPDNLLEFYKIGYQQPFRIVLDAKYRFDRGHQGYPRSNVKHGPPLDAIAQLHRYRDAILFSKKNISPTNITVEKAMGGVVLFPYPASEETFVAHPFYHSIEKTNIGALPLLPRKKSSNHLFATYLKEIFEASPEALYEQQVNYNKSEYNHLLSKLKEKVWILSIEDTNRQQQLDLFFNQGIYIRPYLESDQPEIHQNDGVLLYDENLNIICGYAQVKSFKFQLFNDIEALNIKSNLEHQKYLLLQLESMTPSVLSADSHDILTLNYSNQLGFSTALAQEEIAFLWMNRYGEVKAWKELIRLSKNLSLGTIQDDLKVYRLYFAFSYRKRQFKCYLNRHQKWCFLNEDDAIIEVLKVESSISKLLDHNYKKLTP